MEKRTESQETSGKWRNGGNPDETPGRRDGQIVKTDRKEEKVRERAVLHILNPRSLAA